MVVYKDLVKKVPIPVDKKTKQKDYLPNGMLPIIDQGQEMIGGYTDDSFKEIICDLPVIVFGDHTKAVKYIDFPFGAGADGIKVLQPKEGILPKYLFYTTQYLVLRLEDKGYARHYQYIEKKELEIPPTPEQARIVSRIEELFSQLDNGVETLQKTKQQLAVYRQAVLQQAFCPSAGWKKKTVSEIGDVNLGRQRSPKNISKQYPTKYIRAANITEQGLSLEDILDMEFTPSEREKYCLRDGDIVISEASGSASQVGKPAIWRNEIPDCCFQNTVIRHRVYTEHPEYIFWYYKYLYQSGYFSRIVGGVGINHLGAQNFANIMINVAPYDKQLGIVEQIELKMSVCDDLEKTVENAIQQAEAMRQSILKQAFEGYY